MDNTLDILNEILGTLGQVKNLMEANSPQAQGQHPLNVQEAVVNQAASGTGANMTGVGALLESLTKYIKEFDQSKADVALLGFEYFVETINKTIEFDDSTIKNLESVTDAFNIFSDVIKHLLETEQLDDVSIANIIDSKEAVQVYLNLISSLDWTKFAKAVEGLPPNAADGAKTFNEAMGSISSILSSVNKINNLSTRDKLKFKYFSSNKFFRMLTRYVQGMLGVLVDIESSYRNGNIPSVKTTKAFVDASDHLIGIIFSLKRISFASIMTFKMFGWLMFSAMRQYIKGMMKTINLMDGNADDMKKKAETANIFVTAFNGVIKGLQQLSIATVMLVGSMALTGLMIIKWWDVIWRGGLMTLAILGLSLSTLAILSKFNIERLNSSVDALQKINMYMISLGGAVLLFMGELALIGVLQQNYGEQISTGKSALIDSLISMGLIVGIAHLVLKIPVMKDIEQTIDKLYKLQLVIIALTATAFFNSFLLYQFASYVDGKEGTIAYGFAMASIVLLGTMGVAYVLGKMFNKNKKDIFGAIGALALMGLILIEFAWVTEYLLDLGIMISGHETELLIASVSVAGIMVTMLGIIGIAGFLTKTFGYSNMLAGVLVIAATAGIIHYMTYITSQIINTAKAMEDVSLFDLALTLGIMFSSVTMMVSIIGSVGALVLYFGWPFLIAGVVAIGAVVGILHGMVAVVERVVNIGIKFGDMEDKILKTGKIVSFTMGIIGDMWKSILSMGDPDAEKEPMKAFMAKIPVFGSWFKSGSMMLESIGIVAILGVISMTVNIIDKILGMSQKYSSVDMNATRNVLNNMLSIVNEFVPAIINMLENIDAEGLDAWKGNFWRPSTWGQGSRMNVIMKAIKMTSDIMKMISNAGQMKIIKEFDADGNPIYETLMESDISGAARKIADAMAVFVNALFTELSRVEMEDTDNLKKIKNLFDGGMFSTGLIGMTNSFIQSVHMLARGWVEEDGQGNKTYHRLDINELETYGIILGNAVGRFVTRLTAGLVDAGRFVNDNKKALNNFRDIMVGEDIMSKGLLGTTNFLFRFIEMFMQGGTVVDENGRVVHKSGISINDMPLYGTLLGSAVGNFVDNITSALVRVGDSLDDQKLDRLFRFNDLMLGGNIIKQGLFSMISKIVSVSEAIKKGEDYYDEEGKLYRGSGYPIERLPEVSALIGRSIGSFIENFRYSIDKIIIDDKLVDKSEKAVQILIGEQGFWGGKAGLIGVLERLVKGLTNANINKLDPGKVAGVIGRTEGYFNLVLNMTKNIQDELQQLGFFTRSNVNERALKNYESYLVTLSKIMSNGDIGKLTGSSKSMGQAVKDFFDIKPDEQDPKFADALRKMNSEIIGKHRARQRALKELTESLEKVGDQFERIGNANLPEISTGGGNKGGVVSIKQEGKEINLSKETLNTLLAAIADLKTDASATLSSRNIIVELNGGGELTGRLMYGDPE